MNAFCIDLRSPITTTQIISSIEFVQNVSNPDDRIAIFNHSVAKEIFFFDLEIAIKNKAIPELIRQLKRKIGFGVSGAIAAANLFSNCKKICITSGTLIDSDKEKYNEIYVVN